MNFLNLLIWCTEKGITSPCGVLLSGNAQPQSNHKKLSNKSTMRNVLQNNDQDSPFIQGHEGKEKLRN